MRAGGTAGRAIAAALAVGLLALGASATAHAKPRKGKKPFVVKERSTAVTVSGPPGTVGTAEATCPGKTRAVSGGFHAGPASTANGLLVHESARSGARSWRVSGAIVGGPGSHFLIAYIYCARGIAPLLAQEVGVVQVGPPAVAHGSEIARCPSKQFPVAGGFLGPPATPTTAVLVTRNEYLGKRDWWSVTGGVSPEVGVRGFTTYAYCLPRRRAVQVGQAFAPGETSVTTTTGNCPGPLLGGGFDAGTRDALPLVTESRRVSRGQWQVSAFMLGTTGTYVTATAVCRALDRRFKPPKR
jgi:hypothetical protein